MKTKIQKWGNSLGLRIPKSFARETAIEDGSEVDLSVEGDNLIIRPVGPPKYDLEELLSHVTEDNRHDEISTGEAVGKETW